MNPRLETLGSYIPFVMLIFFGTLLFSAVWGRARGHDGLVVLAFNVFFDVAAAFFIFLIHRALDGTPQPKGRFTISAYTIMPWTLAVTIPMCALFMAIWLTSPGFFEGFLAIAVLGAAMGTLMGSPLLTLRRRAGMAFVIGYVATCIAFVLSFILLAASDLRDNLGDIDPMVLVAGTGLFAAFAGGTCSLGSLVGGFIRKGPERAASA